MAASTSCCKKLHLQPQSRRREAKASIEGSDVKAATATCPRWTGLSPMEDRAMRHPHQGEVAPTGINVVEAFAQDALQHVGRPGLQVKACSLCRRHRPGLCANPSRGHRHAGCRSSRKAALAAAAAAKLCRLPFPPAVHRNQGTPCRVWHTATRQSRIRPPPHCTRGQRNQLPPLRTNLHTARTTNANTQIRQGRARSVDASHLGPAATRGTTASTRVVLPALGRPTTPPC
jgi:hypothetical protein